jgi:hypothetical protein
MDVAVAQERGLAQASVELAQAPLLVRRAPGAREEIVIRIGGDELETNSWICRRDVHVPRDRDAVRLLARRATRAPHTDRRASLAQRYAGALGQNLAGEQVVHGTIAVET